MAPVHEAAPPGANKLKRGTRNLVYCTARCSQVADREEKAYLMIALLLSCLLPLAAADSDAGARAQIAAVAPPHPVAYYERRDLERVDRMRRIEADRVKEHDQRMAYEREAYREPGSLFFWKDSPKQHEAKRQRLQEEEKKHEEARLVQEKLVRDEAEKDRVEGGRLQGTNL